MPSFEVATIKTAEPDNHKPIGLYSYPGGKIYAGQCTLRMLVQYAFNVQDFQVVGGPHWASEDFYEVSALPPDTSQSRQSKPRFVNEPVSQEQREMLQSLLIERFRLKLHRTTKEEPAYLLLRANRPIKMQEAKHKDYIPMLAIGGYGNGGMTGQTVSMSYMATRLSRYLEHPVIDRTGLIGSFDFKLEPGTRDSSEESASDFVDGIFESVLQLGLELKRSKALTEMIVIDEVSKPTGN